MNIGVICLFVVELFLWLLYKKYSTYLIKRWDMTTLELLLTSSSVVMLMIVVYAFGQMFNWAM